MINRVLASTARAVRVDGGRGRGRCRLASEGSRSSSDANCTGAAAAESTCFIARSTAAVDSIGTFTTPHPSQQPSRSR